MLDYAVVFFVMAILALMASFAGIIADAAGFAQVMFFLFLSFAVISLVLTSQGARMSRAERCGKARND